MYKELDEKLLTFNSSTKDNSSDRTSDIAEISKRKRIFDEYYFLAYPTSENGLSDSDEWRTCAKIENDKIKSDSEKTLLRIGDSRPRYFNYININTYKLFSPYLWFDAALPLDIEYHTSVILKNGRTEMKTFSFRVLKYGNLFYLDNNGDIYIETSSNVDSEFIDLNVNDKDIKEKLITYLMKHNLLNANQNTNKFREQLDEKLLSFNGQKNTAKDTTNNSLEEISKISERKKWAYEHCGVTDAVCNDDGFEFCDMLYTLQDMHVVK